MVDFVVVWVKLFKVVVDVVNFIGVMFVFLILEWMGCEVVLINGEVIGEFVYNLEFLFKNF